jgi:hypothetical protein
MGLWNLDTTFSLPVSGTVSTEYTSGQSVGYDPTIVGLSTFDFQISKPDDDHVTVTFFQPERAISVTALISRQNPLFPEFIWADQDYGTTLLRHYEFTPLSNFWIQVESPSGENVGFDFEFDSQVVNCTLTLQLPTWVAPRVTSPQGKYDFHPTFNQREGTVQIDPNEYGLSTVSFESFQDEDGIVYRLFGVDSDFLFTVSSEVKSKFERFSNYYIIYSSKTGSSRLYIWNGEKSLLNELDSATATSVLSESSLNLFKWDDRSEVLLGLYSTYVSLWSPLGPIEADPLVVGLSTFDVSYRVVGKPYLFFFFGNEEFPLELGSSGSFGPVRFESTLQDNKAVVNLVNVQTFGSATYQVEVVDDSLLTAFSTGTSTKNLWYPSYSKSGSGTFGADFSPRQGENNIFANPTMYGLTTFNVSYQPRGNGVIIMVFSTPWGDIPFWEMGRDQAYDMIVDIVRSSPEETTYTVRLNGQKNYVRYTLFVARPYEGQNYYVTKIDFAVGTDQLNEIPVFSLPSGSLPRIEGNATLTPDGNMVCELDYEIINYNKIEKYIIYNLDFLGEVKGCATTIPEAVSYLQQFQKVDQTSFVGYAITRLILSQVLFGKFNTKYLLQKYYSCFLKKLKESEWKDFLPFFLDPKYGVENYHLLFK